MIMGFLTCFSMLTHNHLITVYLDSVPHNLRCFITRLRISAHSLRIHTGRFGVNRYPRHELCLNCKLHDVEDVYHFVCICPKYRIIRLKYINRYYYVRPSVYKFYELLSSNDKKYLYNLACYAKEALTLTLLLFIKI